jgi:hypothetical protein
MLSVNVATTKKQFDLPSHVAKKQFDIPLHVAKKQFDIPSHVAISKRVSEYSYMPKYRYRHIGTFRHIRADRLVDNENHYQQGIFPNGTQFARGSFGMIIATRDVQ